MTAYIRKQSRFEFTGDPARIRLLKKRLAKAPVFLVWRHNVGLERQDVLDNTWHRLRSLTPQIY